MGKYLLLLFLPMVLIVTAGCGSNPRSDSDQTVASSEQPQIQTPATKPTVITGVGSKSVVKPDKPSSPKTDVSKPEPLSLDLSGLGEELSRNPNLGKCLYEKVGPTITELNERRPTPAEIDLMIPCVVEFAPHLIAQDSEPAATLLPTGASVTDHVIDGRLVNVSNPRPQYLFHEQTG